ncbi:GTPase HflX [Longirhabdus pacifica]|uniref:GTPase HflX n=1 Tax=Longirhabdus pacifica TaxID=2305227 RepID=UPI001008E469|nr:GTPase HflX [Longirhabdus pacifica]
MSEEIGEQEERGLLVSVTLKRDAQFANEGTLIELQNLAKTAGVETVSIMEQSRDRIDAATFVGKGKLHEMKQMIETEDIDVVIFNQSLSTAQVRNVEKVLNIKIIDRTQLILDIFAQRASSKEGKLQVELAQLHYLLPRLSGHGIHLSRQGAGIGTRGPGETQLETDQRHIKRRIRDLEKQLETTVRHRELQRRHRKQMNVFQVALVGYTNAGKSTLLNRMTDDDSYAADQLFATLDPKAKKCILPNGQHVILSDTVGFIQDLPHELVKAFRSTLEEVCEADLILHVVDRSSPQYENQMETVESVLSELGAGDTQRLTLWNKIDAIEDEHIVSQPSPDTLAISAMSEADIERVKMHLQDILLLEPQCYSIPVHDGHAMAKMYEIGEVLSKKEEGDRMVFEVRLNHLHVKKHESWLNQYIAKES